MIKYYNIVCCFLVISLSFVLTKINNDTKINDDILFDVEYFKNSLKIKNEEIYDHKYSCIDTIDNDFNSKFNATSHNNLKRFLIYDFKIDNSNNNSYINSNQNISIDIHILNHLNETMKSNIINLNLIRDINCINGIDDVKYYNRKYYRLSNGCSYIKKNDMYTECQFLDITDIKMESIKLNIKFINQNYIVNVKLSEIERYSHFSLLEDILIVVFFPTITLALILISYISNNLLFTE